LRITGLRIIISVTHILQFVFDHLSIFLPHKITSHPADILPHFVQPHIMLCFISSIN